MGLAAGCTSGCTPRTKVGLSPDILAWLPTADSENRAKFAHSKPTPPKAAWVLPLERLRSVRPLAAISMASFLRTGPSSDEFEYVNPLSSGSR
jgi:hypothetical protein